MDGCESFFSPCLRVPGFIHLTREVDVVFINHKAVCSDESLIDMAMRPVLLCKAASLEQVQTEELLLYCTW